MPANAGADNAAIDALEPCSVALFLVVNIKQFAVCVEGEGISNVSIAATNCGHAR